MNEYINSWKSNHSDIVNPDDNDPDAEQAAATVIPWAGGKYGEYRAAWTTDLWVTVRATSSTKYRKTKSLLKKSKFH